MLEGPGFRVAGRCVPARHVGGNFYGRLHLEDGKLGLAVADVAGKGMGAALIMATAKAMVPLLATSADPAATLGALDGRLGKELGRREFVALAFAVYDPATGMLRLANAGLPDPYLIRSGENPRALFLPGAAPAARAEGGDRREALSVRLEPERPGRIPLRRAPRGAALSRASRSGTRRSRRSFDLPGNVVPEGARGSPPQPCRRGGGGSPEDDATVLLLERRPALRRGARAGGPAGRNAGLAAGLLVHAGSHLGLGLPRRSGFSLARARSSAFRARIAAIRSAIGISRRSSGRFV